MKLSAADRQAIESKLNQCEELGERVWSASRRLDESLITLTVDVTPIGYTVTLTEDDQPVRTTTIASSGSEGTAKGSSREFLLQVEKVLESLIAGTPFEPAV